jgi:hypothetical protein
VGAGGGGLGHDPLLNFCGCSEGRERRGNQFRGSSGRLGRGWAGASRPQAPDRRAHPLQLQPGHHPNPRSRANGADVIDHDPQAASSASAGGQKQHCSGQLQRAEDFAFQVGWALTGMWHGADLTCVSGSRSERR